MDYVFQLLAINRARINIAQTKNHLLSSHSLLEHSFEFWNLSRIVFASRKVADLLFCPNNFFANFCGFGGCLILQLLYLLGLFPLVLLSDLRFYFSKRLSCLLFLPSVSMSPGLRILVFVRTIDKLILQLLAVN